MTDRTFLERKAHIWLPVISGILAYVMEAGWGYVLLFVVAGWAVGVSLAVEDSKKRKTTKLAFLVYLAMFISAIALSYLL